MKHFVEARLDCLEVLRSEEWRPLFERACLVFDLQGRIRLVLRPPAGCDLKEEDKQRISERLSKAGDLFWAGEIWSERGDARPSDRALFEEVWQEARSDPPGQDRILVLDRRLSKDAWLLDPCEPPWPLRRGTPPVVSFYSFKGGVGRTTALLAVAVNAARDARRCLIVDFDLEAPAAGALASPQHGAGAQWGLVDFLLEFPVASAAAVDIAEYYHLCDNPKVIGDGEPIYVVPAGTVNEWYLEKLARVDHEYLYRTAMPAAETESPIYALLRALRSKLNPDMVLIDSRAGFHDLGGLALGGLAHLQVLMGLHSEQSWQGLTLTISRLGKEMVLAGKAQRACMMVHAHAPFIEPGRQEQIRAFRERAFDIFQQFYYDPAESDEGEWPLPDPEDPATPHYPVVLTWDQRIAGYRQLEHIAELLTEGDYRRLYEALLERVGRSA